MQCCPPTRRLGLGLINPTLAKCCFFWLVEASVGRMVERMSGAVMQVPLLDLKSQYSGLKDEILAAVSSVLESQVCIGGPVVAELEQKIADLSECKYGIGVSSGTDAILNVLMSMGIGPGHEVITTTFTFFATVGCIARVGAKPVLVDIDPATYNIDPEQVEKSVTKHTKAIMPVHLFGQMADMGAIRSIAERHGLAVIEDAAQAISSTYRGKKAGSLGCAGCFSFFPSKNLGGIGDGGMVVTNDPKLHERLQIMRNHGSSPKYFHRFIGGNFRLDPVQAAALLVKLPHLDEWSAARRRNARLYDARFKDTAVQTPFIHSDCLSIYNQYVVRVPRREEIMAHLKKHEVGCEVYYPVPSHLQECFSYLGYHAGDLPQAERACREVLALPIYPELTHEQIDYVADVVLSAVG